MNEMQLRKINRDRFADKLCNSRMISDKYPNISIIKIKSEGVSGSWDGNIIKGECVFTPSQKAVFLLKCPNGTCTDIGIDLDNEVDCLIRSGGTNKIGEVKCKGYEDVERYGQYECGSKIKYEIIIDYR